MKKRVKIAKRAQKRTKKPLKLKKRLAETEKTIKYLTGFAIIGYIKR